MKTALDELGASGVALPLCVSGTRSVPTGEHRLMLAVLCDAMQAYGGGRFRRRARHLHELRAWFESDDCSYVFAFESVCDALGLDAAYIRRRVLGGGRVLRMPFVHRIHAHKVVAPRASRRRAG